MNHIQFAQEIYNRFGTIKRCRGCFLYTKKGVRLTDMNQENGRAVLGWDAGNAFTFFKNALNRGVTGSFITEDVSRTDKAVSELLASERKVFYFSKKADALKAGLFFSPEGTSVWKPWGPAEIKWADIPCVIIAPPLPWTDSLYILAVKADVLHSVDSTAAAKIFASSIIIPFPLQAAVTRAFYNMIAALQQREEKDWFIYDTILTKYWERKGPYLYPKIPEEKYDSFILHCMDCGVVINPDYHSPSIVPFGADKGVFTKLKNSPFEF